MLVCVFVCVCFKLDFVAYSPIQGGATLLRYNLIPCYNYTLLYLFQKEELFP